MINGILNIYKEKGFTSHDVVAKLRGIFHQKKIGHTGTLDPDAEGVLPVCLGKATKLCDMLTDETKEYRVGMLLGAETDTQDTSGIVLHRSLVQVGKSEVVEAVRSFEGEQQQIPPMYSALKVNGRKLYELARAGIEVERRPRTVHFYHIQIEQIDFPHVVILVECSKGTYMRTLCHDIGQMLGCGGCMESLLRTRVGRFTVGEAKRLDEIDETTVPMKIDAMFDDLQEVVVDEVQTHFLRNGNQIPYPDILQEHEKVRMYDVDHAFLAIYEYRDSRLCPVKMFC